jgi:hypothetical protein
MEGLRLKRKISRLLSSSCSFLYLHFKSAVEDNKSLTARQVGLVSQTFRIFRTTVINPHPHPQPSILFSLASANQDEDEVFRVSLVVAVKVTCNGSVLSISDFAYSVSPTSFAHWRMPLSFLFQISKTSQNPLAALGRLRLLMLKIEPTTSVAVLALFELEVSEHGLGD